MLKSNRLMYGKHPRSVRATMHAQGGSMMLEALIAILIFSMGILAIVGLQGTAVNITSDAKYRADASFVANQAIGEMWGDRNNLAAKAAELSGAVDILPNGQRNIVVAGTQVTVTVTWQLPGQATEHNYIAIERING